MFRTNMHHLLIPSSAPTHHKPLADWADLIQVDVARIHGHRKQTVRLAIHTHISYSMMINSNSSASEKYWRYSTKLTIVWLLFIDSRSLPLRSSYWQLSQVHRFRFTRLECKSSASFLTPFLDETKSIHSLIVFLPGGPPAPDQCFFEVQGGRLWSCGFPCNCRLSALLLDLLVLGD
jgi:hypothetical protein